MTIDAVAPTVTSDPRAVLAQARDENFPVASRVLPRRVRADFMALYGFARLVDDTGDEAPGDRISLLDALEADLERMFTATPAYPLLRALQPTVRAHDLPRAPFLALIEANRRDQVITDYATREQVLAYCRLSAAPVGELVLGVLGRASRDLLALSESLCAGLQVVEQLQDVGEDRARGRVYLPAEDRARFGVCDADLAAPTAAPALRALLAEESRWARSLLDAGAPLVRRLPPRPALAVAAFVAGGRSALTALSGAGFDVLGARPRPAKTTFARAWLAAVMGAR